MVLLKCWTQYVSKFGKPRSGHRTGKGQFSFQSQRKSMSKTIQTTAQLNLLLMLQVRLCLQPFKQDFSSTKTETFQMYKLNLENAEKPEIQLPTSTGL